MEDVLTRIFRVLVRLAIARGVLFPQAAESLKSAYVRAASDQLGGERATDSRLSVMTGLQRRDIARIRSQPAAPEATIHPLARLLNLWHVDPAFGRGAPLPRRGEAGSFEALARAVRKDVHPRTFFDQLLATGAVAFDENEDTVTPLSRHYQPGPGSDDQIEYLARQIADHSAAAVANVLADQAPFFDRSVHFSGLCAEAIAELDAEYRAAEMDLMARLAERAETLKQSAPGTCRFRAGSYFYSEADE